MASLLAGIGGYTQGAQTAQRQPSTTPTGAAPPLITPTAAPTTAQPSTIGATSTTGAGSVDPNAGASPGLPQTPNPVMPNLSGYTGFGNSVLTPQAAAGSNMSNGNNPPTIPGAVPVGMYTNQASQINPNYAAGVQGGASHFIQNYNAQHPLMNLTVDAFNKANQHDSGTAFQMLQQGGQQFRNAVMQANGWTQDQMNQWLNQVAYENPQTFAHGSGTADAFAKFGATAAQPTHYGAQGYGPGNYTGPAGPQTGYSNYTQASTYGGTRIPNPTAATAAHPITVPHAPARGVTPPPARAATHTLNVSGGHPLVKPY